MSAPAASRLAWSIWACSVALIPVALVLGVLSLSAELPPGRERILPLIAGMDLLVLAYGTVGAVIASRRPRNPIGWVCCALALSLAVVAAASGYADYGLYEKGADLPAPELAAWLGDSLVAALGGACFLFLLFPDGRPPSRRWRPLVWFLPAVAGAVFITEGFSPGELSEYSYPGLENPAGIEGATGEVLQGLRGVASGLGIVAVLLSIAAMVRRFRRSRGIERLQLKWVAYAAAVTATSIVVSFMLPDQAPGLVNDGVFLIGVAGFAAIPIAGGIAILRYRLYDIDVVINRTLVYGALTATLAAAYLGMVLLLQLALTPLTEDSDLAIAGSTLAVAALFRPLRGRIQELVDRRFYRRRYDAARTLESFGARLRDEVSLDSLSAELRGVVADTMQPAHVSLWLRAPEAPR